MLHTREAGRHGARSNERNDGAGLFQQQNAGLRSPRGIHPKDRLLRDLGKFTSTVVPCSIRQYDDG